VTEHATDNSMEERYKSLLAIGGNGAVEAALPEGLPLRVVLVGPIKTWWGRIDSDEYKAYNAWRELVRAELIHNRCLVYSPHRAWSGGWHEAAQRVNDMAIMESDLVVAITPPGVEASGTDAEVATALAHNVSVVYAPPGGLAEIQALLASVEAAR
jgi:hypothetical protein